MNKFEPIPDIMCEHQWEDVGCPIYMWLSPGTGSIVPPNADVIQKRKCLVCGRVDNYNVKSNSN